MTTISHDCKQPTQHFACVHRVASLVKRWILGTHQGPISPADLDYCPAEFTFRLNRSTSHSRGNAPAPNEKLVSHVHGPKRKPPDHQI